MNRHSTAAGISILATAIAFLGFCTAPAMAAAGDPPALSDVSATYLSRVLALAVARNDTPGVVALVVGRNGVLYEGAAGKLDPAGPMPVDAIFNIASMTKPVTSVAIMMLMESGKLHLDDPVSKYLPGFDHLKVIKSFNAADGSYETRPAVRAMTIRHLLTHTSGIGYAFSNPIVNRLQSGTQQREWDLPLLQDPGAQWNYSASTRVLGLIVEKVSGQTLEDFDQQHIFKPLGMVDTSYAVAAAKQSRLAASYRHADGAFQVQPGNAIPATPTPPFGGDGGLYSTAGDYGRFMQMMLNGGHLGSARILSAHSVRLMGQNQIGAIFVEQQPAANPALTRPFPLGAGRDKFGLGFQITAPDPDSTRYRSPGSLSWAGIFNTEFWIDPQRHIGGVVMMQYLPFYDESALRTLRDFEAALYRQLP